MKLRTAVTGALLAAACGPAAAQQTINELTRIRRAVIRELHAEGWTFARIGAAAGLPGDGLRVEIDAVAYVP